MVALILGMSMSVFAEDEGYKITSLKALDVCIKANTEDGTISKSDAQKILRDTKPDVVNAYVERETQKVRDALAGQKFSLDDAKFVQDDVVRKEYEIIVDSKTGEKMHIVLEDAKEPNEASASEGSQNKTGTSTTATKEVGNRYFTGSCYYQSGFVTVRLFVENHYTVTSSLGLKERYLTFKEVQGFLYCDNDATEAASGHKLTATKVGESIYYRIKVTCKIGPLPELGGNLTTKYYYCKSAVKLTKKNTNSVDVVQSLQWEF